MKIFEIERIYSVGNDRDVFADSLGYWIKKARPSSLLGKIGHFKIFSKKDGRETVIAGYDDISKKYAMFLALYHFSGRAYKEGLVVAAKNYRGINLPVKVYAFLIKNQNMIIVSDSLQTYGAQTIWEKLSKVPGIGVFGYNTKTRKVFQVDMDDLYNEDVYDDGLNDEIKDLDRDDYVASDNEIEKLTKDILKTRKNIRLFAAKTK